MVIRLRKLQNSWEIPPCEEKWYALNDDDGNNHVASIYLRAAMGNRVFYIPISETTFTLNKEIDHSQIKEQTTGGNQT